MRLALRDEGDLGAAGDESPHEQRVRQKRVRRSDDDRAVVQMGFVHSGYGLDAREIFGPRLGHEAELGGAAVELGAQLVRARCANDAMPEEGDAVAEPIRLVEVVRAQEY